MPIITDLLAEPVRETDWLVYPILGKQGITFFHGRSSLGKTPFALEVARAVALGASEMTCGLEVRCGPTSVLYLESETALRNILPRLHLLLEPIGDWWYEDFYTSGADILNPRHPCMLRLADLSRKLSPELVVWSSIRRFISGDLNKAHIAVDAYTSMIGLFPQAAHLVIAHDNKDPKDESKAGNPDDAFTGSAAWVQQAAVGLHILGRGGTVEPGTSEVLSKLDITKSQLGTDKWTFNLHLGPDGMTWVSKGSLVQRAQALLKECPLEGASERIDWVAGEMGVHRATLYRLLKHSG